jgi:hypothetical protein
MRREVDLLLPDSVVFKALRRILEAIETPVEIELEDRIVAIPDGVTFDIIEKSVHINNFPVGFEDHFRAKVAIGGVVSIDGGIIEPELCFATLYFNPDGVQMTVDFWE